MVLLNLLRTKSIIKASDMAGKISGNLEYLIKKFFNFNICIKFGNVWRFKDDFVNFTVHRKYYKIFGHGWFN